MPTKRQRDTTGSDKQKAADAAVVQEWPTLGQQTSHIKNKLVRAELYDKLKHKQKKQKKAARNKRAAEEARAEELGLQPPPRKQQKTLESTREPDVTMVEEGDEEVQLDEADDEFAAHFSREVEPKVLITTCYKPSKLMFTFLTEMLEVLPCAEYYKRGGFSIKKIVQFASARHYTDLLVFNEDRKEVNGLLHVHLPDGPTAHFRISNMVLGQDIKGHGRASSHRPEIVLNNFNTRLGRRVGRMLGSLFHQQPQFKARRVVTFHNQRDFVFFRWEIGPRFTLKLQSLQKGTFDSKHGEFEWVHKKEMDTSRRRFHL
eukprot:gene8898-9075_t